MLSLSDWQIRLHKHFQALYIQRISKSRIFPLFALEHDLNPTEIEDLKADIRFHIKSDSPRLEHPLPWIVYAAEIGYEYDGQEYWQTFEDSTPGWRTFGNRYWLRDRFNQFHDQYGGAKPAGPWADWFTLICWPIHHAILPKDLQYAFARALFRIRYLLHADMLNSPEIIGEMIKANSWDAKSRFQNLTKDTTLIGQIALALLNQGQQDDESLISPITLERIRIDLEERIEARDWIKQAITRVNQVRLLGISRTPSGTPSATPTSTKNRREQAKTIRIKPRLSLIPSEHDGWQVLFELPNYSQLLSQSSDMRNTLTKSRFEVAGAGGRRWPSSRLLTNNQKVTLHEWPNPDEPLIRLNNAPSELDLLLQTDSLLSPGPNWLFKIGADNVANEIRSLSIRAGNEYVLLSKHQMIDQAPWVSSTPLKCNGVNAVILRVPKEVPTEVAQIWEALGLTQAKTVQVWPAGLPPVQWDGEGRGEWLTTDNPCIGIRVDYPVDSLNIRLEGEQTNEIINFPIDAGKPVFVNIPALDEGSYQLVVTGAGCDDITTGYLEFSIRAPTEWVPRETAIGALAVYMDPQVPAMEDIWEGRASIEITGPRARLVKCGVALLANYDGEVLISKTDNSLSIPVDVETWRSYFEDRFKSDPQIQELYNLARVLKLDIDAGQLGHFSFICEREFASLRWHLDNRRGERTLRLLDDRGIQELVMTTHIGFETPDVLNTLDIQIDGERGYTTIEIPHNGGLFIAKAGTFEATIVVPALSRGRIGLEDLKSSIIRPLVKRLEPSVDSVFQLVQALRVWLGVRHPGDAITINVLRDVQRELLTELFILFGGKRWSLAEISMQETHEINTLGLVGELSIGSRSFRLGMALMRAAPRLVFSTPYQRARQFSEIANEFDLAGRVGVGRRSSGEGEALSLCITALKLASCPENIIDGGGRDLRNNLQHLLNRKALFRAARLFVIAVNSYFRDQQAKIGRLYPNWEWE